MSSPHLYNKLPLYRQLYEILRARFARGEFKPAAFCFHAP